MREILLVADAPWVADAVRAALGGAPYRLTAVADPAAAAARQQEHPPAVVLIDLQIGARGGMALVRDLRAGAGAADRTPPPTILLLDRAADAFLARRSGADAWIRKPFDGFALRRLLDRLTEETAA